MNNSWKGFIINARINRNIKNSQKEILNRDKTATDPKEANIELNPILEEMMEKARISLN